LGAALTGLDTPTLRDVWATAPYLHDGSAATVEAAVQAHTTLSPALTATELAQVSAYVRQIGREETTAPTPTAAGTGLRGEYFAGTTLAGLPLRTTAEAVNFNWDRSAPAAGVPADNFSVRWSGWVEAPAAGGVVFQTRSDDGVRVWVNGVQVINNWTDHSATDNTSAAVTMAAGQRLRIVVEYYERGGQAVMALRWRTPGTTTFTPIPANRLYLP
jgi:hypothetical protein